MYLIIIKPIIKKKKKTLWGSLDFFGVKPWIVPLMTPGTILCYLKPVTLIL